MREITYRGPGGRLVLPSGRTVERGEKAEVTNEDADAARAMNNVNVTVHEGGSDDTDSDSDEE